VSLGGEHLLSTSPHNAAQKLLINSVSVEAEGGVALLTLAREVGDQLTIANHQKQAATCKTKTGWRIKDLHSCVITTELSVMVLLPKASHHCHTVGNSNITATWERNTTLHHMFGHLSVHMRRRTVQIPAHLCW